MNRHPVSEGGRVEAAQFRHELLGRLGLRADANRQDVEAAHYVLVEFLELAPHNVNSWAAARTADMDEAFALLSGPEQGLIWASQRASRAQSKLDEASERHGTAPATLLAPTSAATRKPPRSLILGAVGAVLVVAAVSLALQMGKTFEVPGIAGTPTSGANTAAGAAKAAATPVDPVKVAALLQQISANPKDKAALQSLGAIYFAAAGYQNASVWEQKVLALDPKNQEALLALGADEFNIGNVAEAKKQWLVAAKLYPKVAEVHYDLGFLYFSQSPPDTASMTAEWKQVVAIDPTSNYAKTVATHLASSTSTPGASAAPSAK